MPETTASYNKPKRRPRKVMRRLKKRQPKIRPGGKVRGRTAKPLMTPSVGSVAPPNIYMGGNRASYLSPPANASGRRKRGGRRMPKY